MKRFCHSFLISRHYLLVYSIAIQYYATETLHSTIVFFFFFCDVRISMRSKVWNLQFIEEHSHSTELDCASLGIMTSLSNILFLYFHKVLQSISAIVCEVCSGSWHYTEHIRRSFEAEWKTCWIQVEVEVGEKNEREMMREEVGM